MGPFFPLPLIFRVTMALLVPGTKARRHESYSTTFHDDDLQDGTMVEIQKRKKKKSSIPRSLVCGPLFGRHHLGFVCVFQDFYSEVLDYLLSETALGTNQALLTFTGGGVCTFKGTLSVAAKKKSSREHQTLVPEC